MRLLYIIFILFGPLLTLKAQTVNNESKLVLKDVDMNLVDSILKIEILLDSISHVSSKSMIVLTPRLEAEESDKSYTFDSFIYVGKNRSKVLKRWEMLSGQKRKNILVIRKKESENTQSLLLTTPYEPWMNEANLMIVEQASGCANCDLGSYIHRIKVQTLIPYEPNYSFVYIIPEVEQIKERSRKYSANLSFNVGRSEILSGLGANADILNEIKEIVDEVRTDKDLTINRILIVGYASPEGDESSNMRLSENRAKSFADYLKQHYPFDSNLFSLDWKGEDWSGLRKAIEVSDITNKEQILDVLTHTNSTTELKVRLKKIGGGVIYKELLSDYYPELRRNELTIHFVVKAFDVDEAKSVIRTRPQYLSLNEMYLLANSYPKDSEEFKEVFDIASRLFPDDEVARLNAATAELENGSVDKAIEKLSSIDMPEAWNNLGIAYAQKGNYAKALELFHRAKDSGIQNALQNINELQRVQVK